MITRKPEPVSVVVFNVTSEPPAAASGIGILFFFCKATDRYLSSASELTKLCTPAAEIHEETFPAKRQESSVYSTCLNSFHREQRVPE